MIRTNGIVHLSFFLGFFACGVGSDSDAARWEMKLTARLQFLIAAQSCEPGRFGHFLDLLDMYSGRVVVCSPI